VEAELCSRGQLAIDYDECMALPPPPRVRRNRPAWIEEAWALWLGSLLLAAFAGFATAGCARPAPRPEEPRFRVVLLLASDAPPEVSDALEKGLEEVEKDLFAAGTLRRVQTGQALIEALRETGGKAPDLVYCHVPGEEYVVVEEAAAYRDTHFVTIPGRTVGPNVSGVVFRVDGAAYVAGATLAALAGGRPVLLVDSGESSFLPGLRLGFGAGVASAGGALQETGDLESAVEAIRSGDAGGVFHTGFGVPQSLREACMAAGAPLVVLSAGERAAGCLGTVCVRMSKALRNLAGERWAGTLEGRIYTFSLGSGIVDFALEPGRTVPEPVRAVMDSSRKDVLSGIAEIEDLGM